MRKRRLQFASMSLGLLAYVLNSAVLAWGFVQCEEPGGLEVPCPGQGTGGAIKEHAVRLRNTWATAN